MNKKQGILLALVLFVSMASLSGYFYYHKKSEIVTKNKDDTATTSMQPVTSTTSITYVSVDLYKDEENSASYIKIQGGVPDAISEKINTELFKRSSCFADDKKYLNEDLLFVYDSLDIKPPYTKADIAKMNVETLRKNLFLYGKNYQEHSSQKVAYVDKNLFSVEGHYQNYCGGAYPNSGVDAMNFDLQTGKEISFAGLFKDFEKDKPAIKRAILKSLQETGSFDPSAECPTDGLNLDIEWIESTLTKEGFKIESLGYPHVAQACEPASTVIPYKVLLPYMNTSLPYLKEVLK